MCKSVRNPRPLGQGRFKSWNKVVHVICLIALAICLWHIRYQERVISDMQEYQELGCQGHYQGAE